MIILKQLIETNAAYFEEWIRGFAEHFGYEFDLLLHDHNRLYQLTVGKLPLIRVAVYPKNDYQLWIVIDQLDSRAYMDEPSVTRLLLGGINEFFHADIDPRFLVPKTINQFVVEQAQHELADDSELREIQEQLIEQFGAVLDWPEEQSNLAEAPEEGMRSKDSDHFTFPESKRREIAKDFLQVREKGRVGNKNAWAKSKYGITGKTILKYVREFDEEQ